jgi:nucleoside-diphosphate-sugar epimerase
MTGLSALFIGGNGIISAAASRLAVERGFDLTLLNRGTSTTRPAIEGARTIVGDASDPASIRAAIGSAEYDVVVSFQLFRPEQAASDITLFEGRVGQYVFISSAAAYQKPVQRLPITESTPLVNPEWQYARDKIACELHYLDAYRSVGFPVTIVRPSHTYDPTLIPLDGEWTTLDRMLRGKPVLLPGDGTSLWTLTHHTDFARGLVGLLGNPRAIGDTFQITSDEVLTWNQIAQYLGDALQVTPILAPTASRTIAEAIPEWGPGLLGDKMHSVIFDNSKIRSIVPDFRPEVPFWRGAREIVEWYLADPRRQVVDRQLDARIDRLLAGVR